MVPEPPPEWGFWRVGRAGHSPPHGFFALNIDLDSEADTAKRVPRAVRQRISALPAPTIR